MRVAGHERRASKRVPLDQPAVVQIRHGQEVEESFPVQVIDMSSHGLRFQCEHELFAGARVEIHVLWPVRLDNDKALEFYAAGHVVRRDADEAAMTIDQKEFRTAGAWFDDIPGVVH